MAVPSQRSRARDGRAPVLAGREPIVNGPPLTVYQDADEIAATLEMLADRVAVPLPPMTTAAPAAETETAR